MELKYYIIRRLLVLIPTIIGLLLLTFILLRAVPVNDLIANYINQKATPAQKLIEKKQAIILLGLGQPLPQQFFTYLTDIANGNLGNMYSAYYNGAVLRGIELFLPVTLEIAILTVIFSVIVSIPLGTYIGARPNSVSDSVGRVFSLIFYAMPIFWLALMLQYAFGKDLLFMGNYGLPINGQGFPLQPVAFIHQHSGYSYSVPTHMLFIDAVLNLDFPLAVVAFEHLILPVLTLSMTVLAGLLRFIRAGMVDTSNQEYIKTARAKGVPEKLVLKRHIRKNALLPSVTVIGLLVAGLLGGAVVVEDIFQITGLGRLSLAAITGTSGNGANIQFFGVAGTVLFFGLILMLTNLIVDIVYAFLDPRIRY